MATATVAPTVITKGGGNFQSNPMKPGINPSVITEAVVRGIPNFEDRSKIDHKLVTRYVNAKGQEASRFYTLSFNEKATLVKDLIGLGLFTAETIPNTMTVEALIKLLVGKQCVVVATAGKPNQQGQPTAKISSVTEPMEGQNVVPPAKTGNLLAAPKPAARKAAAPPPADVEDGTEISDLDIPF
jgi:hypothetical protein